MQQLGHLLLQIILSRVSDIGEFKEVEWSIDPTEDFKAFSIKIVMKSENPAFVPQGQALRAIALV